MDPAIIVDNFISIQSKILEFLDDESGNQNISFLIDIENHFYLTKNHNQFKLFLQLLSNISIFHHRSPNFFEKIKHIFIHYKNYIIHNFTGIDLIHIFKCNNTILLFLYKDGIIKFDDFISKYNILNYPFFLLLPEAEQNFSNLIIKNEIFNDILSKFKAFYTENITNILKNYAFLSNMLIQASNKFQYYYYFMPFYHFKLPYNLINYSKIFEKFKIFIDLQINNQIVDIIKYLLLSQTSDSVYFFYNEKLSLEYDIMYKIIKMKFKSYQNELIGNQGPYNEESLDLNLEYNDKFYDELYSNLSSVLDKNVMPSEIKKIIENKIYNLYKSDTQNENSIINAKIDLLVSDLIKIKEENKISYITIISKITFYIDEIIEIILEFEFNDFLEKMISILKNKCQYISDESELILEKLNKGENDSYICELIRNDSINDFIIYVNRTNTSLTSRIKPSIYETHSILNNKSLTLIEYATFFGSIQIFQFLRLNNVELSSSLWTYAIHGRNPEIIHILEEYHLRPQDSFYILFNEAIMCYHNEIAEYIENNYLFDSSQISLENDDNFSDYLGILFCNYDYFPKKFESLNFFELLCSNNYIYIVENILKNKKENIHELKKISTINIF